MTPHSTRPAAWALHSLAWCALALVIWALHEPHYEFSDPVAYLNLANSLGSLAAWPMDNPFQHRLALVGLHGLSLQIFGITPLGAFLPQLLLLFGALLVVGAFCRSHLEIFVASLITLALLPQTRTIFPDLGGAVFMAAAMLAMAPRAGFRRGALFALSAVIAFLFKETAIFIVLPFLVVLLADARDLARVPERRAFYAGAVVTGLGLMALYLGTYHVVWGDALARINSVSSFGQLHLWSVSGRLALLERLFVDPLPEMQRVIGAAFVLSLLASVYFLARPRPDGQGPLRGGAFVAVFHLGWVFAFAFGTTSLSSYQPLPFLDRMLGPVVLTGAILCAYGVQDLSRALRPAQARLALAFTALVLVLVGHKTAENIAGSVAFGIVSNVHEARNIAAEMITADPAARLVVAERRSRTLFPVYTNYEDRRDQILNCARLREARDAPAAAYLVDYRAAILIGDIHGVDTCTSAVKDAARAARARVIYDDDRVFFAIRESAN